MIHDSSPAIALDDDCLSTNDLSCVAIGKINSKSDDRHLGGFKEPNVRPTNGNKETRNNSFASVLKSNQPNNLSSSNMIYDSSPVAIALDDDCLSANDLSCVAIGKIKDINTLSNLSVILNDEG
ncbi:hypothetical protein Tco_1379916, partial [Tanacetum coccineum]